MSACDHAYEIPRLPSCFVDSSCCRSAPVRHAAAGCRRGFAVLATIGLALGCGTPARAADDSWQHAPYSLGQGLYFPEHGLRIGGYANLHYYNIEGEKSTLRFQDISLFVTKDLGTRWQLFGEVDAGDTLKLSGSHSGGQDSELDVERLYVDYHASQAISFRLGKFLTPVGQWNLIHADPLTWTVSRPLSTSAAFARHAAGIMMFGTVSLHGRDLDYWVFADDSKSLGIGQDQDHAFSSFGANGSIRNNFRQALGARVLYHMMDDRLSVGMSCLDYTLQLPRQKYQLAGLDFSWSARYLNLSGEAIHRTGGSADVPVEHGGFLEAELPLSGHLYLVGRYERYHTSLPSRTTTLRTFGFNYRPIQGLVLKVEHREGSNDLQLAPSGWLASIAVLF